MMAAATPVTPDAAARPARFRLVDDFIAQYVKYQGREPRTLEELAIARANSEHARRLAQIKVMSKKLALLQEFLPGLAERDIKLANRNLTSWDGGKTVRIESPMLGRDNKLCEALLALGFHEVERKDLFRDEQTVTLQHGRWLVVAMTVTKATEPAPMGEGAPA